MENMNSRIEKLIEALDITRTAFAKKINVTQPYISKLIAGNGVPSDRLIEDICEKYDVNEDWLRTGKGDMFIVLTDQQKIMKYTGLLLKDEDSAVANAIQALIVTYEQLDDTSKATLNKIIMQYIDNLKKSQ